MQKNEAEGQILNHNVVEGHEEETDVPGVLAPTPTPSSSLLKSQCGVRYPDDDIPPQETHGWVGIDDGQEGWEVDEEGGGGEDENWGG